MKRSLVAVAVLILALLAVGAAMGQSTAATPTPVATPNPVATPIPGAKPTPAVAQAAASPTVTPTPKAPAAYVWIEGENTEKTNVPINAWVKGENPKLLSAGDALSGLSKPSVLPNPCFVLYQFDCPAEGTYDLYFRHGTMANIGAMRYRFVKLGADGKPVKQPGAEEGWLKFDHEAAVQDSQITGQFRTIEWSKQPQVRLEKATYYLDLQVTGLNPAKVTDKTADVWILIDAICLTTQPFTPSGAQKPGEKPGAPGSPAANDTYY